MTGTVFVSYWKIPAKVLNDLDYFGEYASKDGGFWLMKSDDQGRNWSDPYYLKPAPNEDSADRRPF